MRSIICIQDGNIWDKLNNRAILEPAILFDKECSCVLAWGEANVVELKFNRFLGEYKKAGLNTEHLLYIQFSDTRCSVEEACYILKRCVEYTATIFLWKVCEKVQTGNFMEYVRKEMKAFEIDLSA